MPRFFNSTRRAFDLEAKIPGPGDGSSVVWLYHSHVDEPKDVESGLVGTIIITRRGMAGQ